MYENNTLITLNKINFLTEPKQYLLKGVNLTINRGEKIGFVGPNGAGKSTLIKIIKGELKPNAGKVKKEADIAYLPQVNNIYDQKKIVLYEYLQEQMEEWWKVLEFTQENFSMKLREDQILTSLSGGELIKLNLSVCFLKKPELLLLDEPTNHLDILGRKQLETLLKEFRGSYLIVSHDAFFLNRTVQKIWELNDKNIEIYGVGYDEYKKEKQRQIDAKERKYLAAKKEMSKLQERIKRERIKADNSSKKGRNSKIKRFATRKGQGFFKNRYEQKQGKKKEMFEDRENTIQEKMDNFYIGNTPELFFKLKEKGSRENKLLIDISKAGLKIKKPKIEIIKEFDFTLRYGEKIVISGLNGGGKTTFLKAITGKDSRNIELKNDKFYHSGDMSISYIDQNYRSIDKDKSILQNALLKNPETTQETAKRVLASLNLKSDPDFKKKAGQLSGGELARLTLATEVLRNLDLLILDEPTNNLDIESKETIIKILSFFPGSVLAVSHDIDFLNRIRIDKAFVIKNKELKPMKYGPKEKEDFYQELVKRLWKN